MYKSIYYIAIGIAFCSTLFVGNFFATATTNVPDEYYANYKIQWKREELLETLENLEASVRVGVDIPTSTFSDLSNLFSLIFPYFPKSPSNNIIYKQCELSVADLSKEVTSYKYMLFKDKCFTPLGVIVNQIKTKYTVRAEVSIKPQAWPAPLNVTLDARASVDPSNDTIPSEYFFWYYKDVNGIDTPIGKWPVVNYTFTEPWNHIVHLTVRSANWDKEWIFDGEDSVSVNVSPMAAQIIVFINGKKASEQRVTKVGMQDSTTTITIDASATRPMGARQILSHTWRITSSNNAYSYVETFQGAPGELSHTFPQQWTYKLQLETIDNENNRAVASFDVSVSDPVAIIKAKPEEWTTSTAFVFDASASYSIGSRVKKYQWQVMGPDWTILDLVDAKELKKQFLKPWLYTIKLSVTDIGWSTSTDTFQLQVGSTPPVPSFLVTPTSELKYPSRFILDATATVDEDVRQWWDTLRYRWTFTSPEQVSIDSSEPENKRITVSFNNPGVYKAKLEASDRFGETRSIEKEIKVESTLRPEILITPVVSFWWSDVSFYGKANKAVIFYDRDFGDGKRQQSTDPKVVHRYEKTGIYSVTLRVATEQWEQNSLTKQVFIGQKDMPVAAWTVKSAAWGLELTPQGSCVLWTGSFPAYTVDRYEQLLIDATASRSTQWDTSNLRISFHPKNDEIHNKTVFNYKFSELGCQRVDITVEDASVWKQVTERVRFDVKNALPVMQNLTLQFPQSTKQQNLWIGVPTTSIANEWLSLDTSLSSVVIKAQVQWARDPDGTISYFRRWYYPNTDDTRKEWFKITPASIQTATFVIPKPWSPTEYSFVVEAVDNDGDKMTSEKLLWKWPVIFFPPGEVELDQPLVTLTTDAVNIKAWDPITFSVKTTIPSDRPDFEATRMIKYDFDGDGIYDQTTKKTEVLYSYQKPGEYKPKAAVYYRDRAGVWFSEKITVVKAVTPRLVYSTHDKLVLVRDLSIGDVEEKTICMNQRNCSGSGNQELFTGDVFLYRYPEYGEYMTRLRVIDAYGNELQKEDKLTIQAESWFALLSVPEVVKTTSGAYEVSLWWWLENTLHLYLADEKRCYLDLDILRDSNGDGDPTTDIDVACNTLVTEQFIPTTKQQQGILYRVVWWKVVQESFIITFLDIEESFVPEEYVGIAKEIDMLLSSLPSTITDTHQWYYKESLQNLKWSLGDASERNSLVIQLRDLVGTYPQVVPTQDKEKLATLLTTLSDTTVQSAYGGTLYDTAKANIVARFQEPAKTEVDEYFKNFEKNQWNQTTMKQYLDMVIQRAASERDAGNIDEVDFNYIRTNLCDIIVYYELPSKSCGTVEEQTTENQQSSTEETKKTTTKKTTTWSSTLSKVLKIILYIVIALAVVFGVLILIFAIKAKKQQQQLGDQSS